MSYKTENILSLDSKGAMEFFLKSDQYHGFELPEYFVFDKLLENVKEAVDSTPYAECLLEGTSPELLPDVNLDILLNKDGRYAVRPIVLANPFLYYFLVREVCNEQSWTIIKGLFGKFNVPHISSCALPVVPKEKEPFHSSTAILNWWNAMEQRSIELSLEYRYMFISDITNCYGSVNPQTFDWAFSLKATKHEREEGRSIAQNIQMFLRAFQQGRNIGIPQGSSIFDFVAEIVLGYADLLLHEAIEKEGITAEYEIIRYRDDYRVFCNDMDALERISYILQHVLERLNFRMNSKKTKISESIVTDSIKSDKLAYIYNTPIFNKKGVDFDSFEKHLLFILMFARKYPDSGSIKTLLSDIDKRIEGYLTAEDENDEKKTIGNDKEKKGEVRKMDKAELKGQGINSDELEEISQMLKSMDPSDYAFLSTLREAPGKFPIHNNIGKQKQKRTIPGGSVRAMSAICVQIALENVTCSHYALRVLSRLVDSLNDEKEKNEIMSLVYSKLNNQPNSDFTQLWLQNITFQHDKKNGSSPYSMRLCRVVAGDNDVELWNNEWLKPELSAALHKSSIVDAETLKKVTPVITFREKRAYDELLAL